VSRRLRKLEVGGLDEEQRALYQDVASGPRSRGPQSFALCDEAGRLEGPFNAMLLSPRLGGALQALGAGVLAHALATRSDLTDAEYQAGRRSVGDEGLFELTTLVGYYATLALQLRVFRVPAPGGDDGDA
jgi:hypothetical protein